MLNAHALANNVSISCLKLRCCHHKPLALKYYNAGYVSGIDDDLAADEAVEDEIVRRKGLKRIN